MMARSVYAIEDWKFCPNCGNGLVGEPIPEEEREHFGGKTTFTRLVSVNDRQLDRQIGYCCPFCWKQWNEHGVNLATMPGVEKRASVLFHNDARPRKTPHNGLT